jgi:hypothetical protein
MGGLVAPVMQSFDAAGGVSGLTSNPALTAQATLDQIGQKYTGYSFFPQLSNTTGWHPEFMIGTYGGLIAGVIGHMIANKLGVNRYMKRIPLVGKWVQL